MCLNFVRRMEDAVKNISDSSDLCKMIVLGKLVNDDGKYF